MGRTPAYNIETLPRWAAKMLSDKTAHIQELEAQIETLEGQLDTLEGMFERSAIVEFDGIPVDSTVTIVQTEAHEETTSRYSTDGWGAGALGL